MNSSNVRASAFVGTSLDGFIARPNGAFDFLSAGGADTEPHGFEEFLATVDALVMGRNTYDVVLPMSRWPYGDKPVFVLTSRPLSSTPSGVVVETVSGVPSEILATISSRGIRHAYVDGGFTVQAFIRAGLIQRLIITRVPVLIGSGIALFGSVDADIPVRHISTRQLAGGAVQSEYAIDGPPSSIAGDTRI